MASAYVFNVSNQSINLYLNQSASGSISGVSAMNGYAPSSATHPFNPSGGSGETVEFGAQTQVVVETPLGRQVYQVNAGGVPPGQDIQLFLFPAHAVLSWGFGDEVLSPAE
jgi:hypothetical protein